MADCLLPRWNDGSIRARKWARHAASQSTEIVECPPHSLFSNCQKRWLPRFSFFRFSPAFPQRFDARWISEDIARGSEKVVRRRRTLI